MKLQKIISAAKMETLDRIKTIKRDLNHIMYFKKWVLVKRTSRE